MSPAPSSKPTSLPYSRFTIDRLRYPSIPVQHFPPPSKTERSGRMTGKAAVNSLQVAGGFLRTVNFARRSAGVIGQAIRSPSSPIKFPSLQPSSFLPYPTDTQLSDGWQERCSDARKLLTNTKQLQASIPGPKQELLWAERDELLAGFDRKSLERRVHQSAGPTAHGGAIRSAEGLLYTEAYTQATLGYRHMPLGDELDMEAKSLFDTALAASASFRMGLAHSTESRDDMDKKGEDSDKETIG